MDDNFDYKGFAIQINRNMQELNRRTLEAAERFELRQDLIDRQNYLDESDVETLLETYKLRVGLKIVMETIPGMKEAPGFKDTYHSLERDIKYLESIVIPSMARQKPKLISSS